FGKNHIAFAIYQSKLYEITALQYVFDHWNAWVGKFHLPAFLTVDISGLSQWLKAIHQGKVAPEYKMLVEILSDVGSYLRYPAVAILLLYAYIVYTKSVVLKFQTVFSMKSMRQYEQKDWPQITPVVSLNLAKEDINKGPWAMAMSPMQFGKAYRLLEEKTGDDGKPAVTLIRSEAYQVFVMQLGTLWTHVNALPIYTKALFAIFAASANNDRDSANKLIKQINDSATDS